MARVRIALDYWLYRADDVGAFLAFGTLRVLAVQVPEQEHQWKRERPDKRSNPSPDFEAASSTLSNSTGKIYRTDKSDQGYSVHDARSNAA
jgi:hypothetical protein